MIRFEFVALALLAAPLSVPAYLIPHVSHGCMSSRRALSLSLRPARVSSPVALQMNLGERFVRLFKANVNDLLSKNEDPEKLLVQGSFVVWRALYIIVELIASERTTVHLLQLWKICRKS